MRVLTEQSVLFLYTIIASCDFHDTLQYASKAGSSLSYIPSLQRDHLQCFGLLL